MDDFVMDNGTPEQPAGALNGTQPVAATSETNANPPEMTPEEAKKRAEIRETRRILRRVQDHLFVAHNNLGAVRETLGMVEVFHHPESPIGSLNYITPRRNTAWISRSMIEQGLQQLTQYGRVSRVQYIEGLYPPQFAKSLRDLKLDVERETPVMVYQPEGILGAKPPAAPTSAMPDGVTIEPVNDQRGIELWWYVWQNAYYDVLTLGVEPLFVGREVAAIKLGHQLDFLVYRYGFPVGVARLSIQGQSAHVLALALLKEARTPPMLQALHTTVIKAALARDVTLIFAPGETEADRKLCRDLGYVDFGSIVCYAAKRTKQQAANDDILAQPLLSF
ncbi:MAG: hypothetical protein H6672_06505 [Anaerolineaceae bacterium]|nr:hypothetical protein [Anaerolineaceae bacterium]